MKTICAGVGIFAMWVGCIGVMAFHFYTASLINTVYGFFWAAVALSTPPFSDLFWMVREFQTNGITSFWFQCLGGLLVALAVGSLCIWLASVLEKREKATA